MLSGSLVSTEMAVACPPASLISRSTVLIVDCWEFGSGGNGFVAYASEVDFAATTTRRDCQKQFSMIDGARTCISILRQINDNLSANATRSSHHQRYLTVLCHCRISDSRISVQCSSMELQIRGNCHPALIEVELFGGCELEFGRWRFSDHRGSCWTSAGVS